VPRPRQRTARRPRGSRSQKCADSWPAPAESVKDLNTKIRAFIDGWNRCHPFVWTKTAEDILKKANRHQTSETLH